MSGAITYLQVHARGKFKSTSVFFKLLTVATAKINTTKAWSSFSRSHGGVGGRPAAHVHSKISTRRHRSNSGKTAVEKRTPLVESSHPAGPTFTRCRSGPPACRISGYFGSASPSQGACVIARCAPLHLVPGPQAPRPPPRLQYGGPYI